jgi:hypothetical protein
LKARIEESRAAAAERRRILPTTITDERGQSVFAR